MNIDTPEGLGPKGLDLWHSITEVFDFADEPAALATLEHAARVTDLIASLEAEAMTQPRTVKGSQGQQVINPLIGEARAQRSLLDKLLKSLKLPESDEQALARSHRRSQAGKIAANARWGNA